MEMIGNKAKEFVVTSSMELRMMVQHRTGYEDLTRPLKKKEFIFSKYLVVALSNKYTKESYNDISRTMKYKNHASIYHALNTWEDLKTQKVLEPWVDIFNDISEAMDLRIKKRRYDKLNLPSAYEVKKDYEHRIWVIVQKNHSIRRRLQKKLDELEKELKTLKNGK